MLKKCYDAHGAGREQPSLECLQDILQLVIKGFDHVYIMVDALDECADRSSALRFIEMMTSFELDNLHLLLTSRPEPDIKRSLARIARLQTVLFEDKAVRHDIAAYLDKQLSLIQHWDEPTRNTVKVTLLGGSGGM